MTAELSCKWSSRYGGRRVSDATSAIERRIDDGTTFQTIQCRRRRTLTWRRSSWERDNFEKSVASRERKVSKRNEVKNSRLRLRKKVPRCETSSKGQYPRRTRWRLTKSDSSSEMEEYCTRSWSTIAWSRFFFDQYYQHISPYQESLDMRSVVSVSAIKSDDVSRWCDQWWMSEIQDARIFINKWEWSVNALERDFHENVIRETFWSWRCPTSFSMWFFNTLIDFRSLSPWKKRRRIWLDIRERLQKS